MAIIDYWPTVENIDECIRTEAEELEEEILLSIHEPMELEHTIAGKKQVRSEQNLLKTFLESERPIPIVGRSGVGKSHIIRWLHARIRVLPEAKKWKIVSIPKNASLRKTLELILDGLEGKAFGDIRKQLAHVVETLSIDEVVEHLLVQTKLEIKNFHKYPENLDKLESLVEWCAPEMLPSLIGDGHFSDRLIEQNTPMYRMAERIISGAVLGELGVKDYEISGEDLQFNGKLNPANLSREAQNFYVNCRLKDLRKAEKAAQIINLGLSEACQKLVGSFFQIGGGNFTDLFEKIRTYLFEKDMKLFILVEDMTAISVIEKVLIDSLIQEGQRVGVRTLCELRSVIATTEDYKGYTRRRDQILTRANGEWRISSRVDDDQAFFKRLEAFISRYLNAARTGRVEIVKQFKALKEQAPHLPKNISIWNTNDSLENELSVFGQSEETQIPLFPFNRAAIRFFAEKYCQPTGQEFQFIPREIIENILRQPLWNFRAQFEESQFPPPTFQDSPNSSNTLRSELLDQLPDEWRRANVFAAIWAEGKHVPNLERLSSKLSPIAASVYGLAGLAKLLENNGKYVQPTKEETEQETEQDTEEEPPVDIDNQWVEEIIERVRVWFDEKSATLAQNDARDLRNELVSVFSLQVEPNWFGIKKLEIPKGGTANRQWSIYIPQAAGRDAESLRAVEFCSEKEFQDSVKKIFLEQVAIALLKHSFFMKQTPSRDWFDYPGGVEDLAYVTSFASKWVPIVVDKCVEVEREKLSFHLGEHYLSAVSLGVIKSSFPLDKKIKVLLSSCDDIEKQLGTPFCDDLTELRRSLISEWEGEKANWLDLISPSDRGWDYRLFSKSLKEIQSKRLKHVVKQQYRTIFRQLESYKTSVKSLSGENSAENVCELLELMESTCNDIKDNDLWPLQFQPSAGRFISSIRVLIEIKCFGVVKAFSDLDKSDDIPEKIRLLNVLNKETLGQLKLVMEVWEPLSRSVNLRLDSEMSDDDVQLQCIVSQGEVLLADAQKTFEELTQEKPC